MERKIRDELKGMCFLVDRLVRHVLCEINQNSISINKTILQTKERGLSASDIEYFRGENEKSKNDNRAFTDKIIALQNSCHAMLSELEPPKVYSIIEVGKSMERQLSVLTNYANSGSFDQSYSTIKLIPNE